MKLNIESWNIQELKDIFNINEPFTVDNIKKTIQEYIDNNIDNLSSLIDNDDKEVVIEFIKKASNKLVNYCNSLNNEFINEVPDNKLISSKNLIIDKTQDTFEKMKIYNPFKNHTRIINLNINTIFRKNYSTTSPTDFVFTLPTYYKNVVSMRIATFEFPNTVYMFNTKHLTNEFTIVTYKKVGSTVSNVKRHIIRIPDGMYGLDQFIDYLNNSIFNKREELRRVVAIFNDKRTKLNFVRKAATTPIDDPTLIFDLDFRISSNKERPIQLNMGWIMGYRKPYYKYSDDYLQFEDANTIDVEGFNPEGPLNLFGTPYFLLHINDFNTSSWNIYETMFQEGLINTTHIIDKIPNSGAKTIIQTNLSDNVDKIRRYNGPVDIKKLEVKLLDQFGLPLVMQSSDYSFTIQLEILQNT